MSVNDVQQNIIANVVNAWIGAVIQVVQGVNDNIDIDVNNSEFQEPDIALWEGITLEQCNALLEGIFGVIENDATMALLTPDTEPFKMELLAYAPNSFSLLAEKGDNGNDMLTVCEMLHYVVDCVRYHLLLSVPEQYHDVVKENCKSIQEFIRQAQHTERGKLPVAPEAILVPSIKAIASSAPVYKPFELKLAEELKLDLGVLVDESGRRISIESPARWVKEVKKDKKGKKAKYDYDPLDSSSEIGSDCSDDSRKQSDSDEYSEEYSYSASSSYDDLSDSSSEELENGSFTAKYTGKSNHNGWNK